MRSEIWYMCDIIWLEAIFPADLVVMFTVGAGRRSVTPWSCVWGLVFGGAMVSHYRQHTHFLPIIVPNLTIVQSVVELTLSSQSGVTPVPDTITATPWDSSGSSCQQGSLQPQMLSFLTPSEISFLPWQISSVAEGSWTMGRNPPNLLGERNCSPVTVAATLKMEQENFASLMDFSVRTVSRVE